MSRSLRRDHFVNDDGERILPTTRKFPAGRNPIDWLSSEFEIP